MSYDSPSDADTRLLTSINNCIKRKDIRDVISYNFDSVLEQNYNPSYKSSSSEISNSRTTIGRCTIHHVHGYIPYDYSGKVLVNNMVFTDYDYYQNMKNPYSYCNSTQRNIFSRNTIVFVGASFVDANMKEILRERKEKARETPNFTNVYAFLKMPSFEGRGTEIELMRNKYKLLQQSYFDTLDVKILWVDDFNEIPSKIDAF